MVSSCVVVSACLFALLSLLRSSAQGYVISNLTFASNGTTTTTSHNPQLLVKWGETPKVFWGGNKKGKNKKTRPATTSNFISLPLHNWGEQYYTTPITIGGQHFNILVDSGSHGFWVYDTCLKKSKEDEEGRRVQRQRHPGQMDGVFERHFYDREQSNSYSPDYDDDYYYADQLFTKKYSSGHRVFGSMALETVKIGGAVVKQVPFATVTSLGKGGMALSGLFDGIMGLASNYDTSSGSTRISLLEKMVQEQIVEREIVSFRITRAQSTSRLVLGGIDSNLFVGKLQYIRAVPLDISTKWLVEGCRLKYGELGVADDLVAGAKFHFDSGISRIRIPVKAYNDLVRKITGIKLIKAKKKSSGGGGDIIATIKCDALRTLSNFEIEIAGSCPATQGSPESLCKRKGATKVKKSCAGGQQAGTTVISFSPHEYFEEDPEHVGQCNLLVVPGKPDKWRIGIDPFFRKYYIAFDYTQRTIGFAPSSAPTL